MVVLVIFAWCAKTETKFSAILQPVNYLMDIGIVLEIVTVNKAKAHEKGGVLCYWFYKDIGKKKIIIGRELQM
jgi:hypothetical protein